MRHNWVKRAMALLLAAMVFSLTACGGSSSSSSSDSDSEEEETEEEEEEEDDYIVEEGTSVEIEPVTMVDTDDCSMVVTGVSVGDINEYENLCVTLTVEIENKTETELTFYPDYAYINGLMAFPSNYWTFEAGETGEAQYYISTSSTFSDYYNEAGFTDIYVIFEVLDETGDDAETVAEGSTHIYPYGEENAVSYEWEVQDTDIVLSEENDVTILCTSASAMDGVSTSGTIMVNLYAENSSESDLKLRVGFVAINGTEVDPIRYSYVIHAGKSYLFTYSQTLDDYLENLEITTGSEVETVDIQIVIYDLETEEELFTTETVTISMN